MTSWQRNNAIRSGAGDMRPDERVGGAEDRFCDRCPGTRYHAADCPVLAEIRRMQAEERARQDNEWQQELARYARSMKLATKKGRAER